MQDKNKEVRRVCDMTLEIISVSYLERDTIEMNVDPNRNVIQSGPVELNWHVFVIIIKHGLKQLKDNKFHMTMMNHYLIKNLMVIIQWHLENKMIISINLVTTMQVKIYSFFVDHFHLKNIYM